MTPSGSSPFKQARWAWPAVAMLLAQMALFAALAPRGFEFTDEAFYLLNGLHWREFTAVYSLFGAYLELPMRLTGGNVAALRVLTMLSLAASGALLGHELQRHSAAGRSAPRLPRFAFWLVGAAGGLYFFGVLSTLRVPSYNTIALATSAIATALLLRSMDATTGRSRTASAIAYGFVMGICGLCKGSTGFLVGCLHLAYFCWANPPWRRDVVLQCIGGVLCGLALQLGLMTLTHPGWIAELQAGAALFSYDTGGKLGAMVKNFRWELQGLLRWSPAALAGLLVWGMLLRWLRARTSPAILGWLIVLPTAAVALLWMTPTLATYWWPASVLLIAMLLMVQLSGRDTLRLQPAERRELALWVLLLCLPFAVSFGTNMAVLWHSQLSAVYIVLMVMVRLERLWQNGNLRSPLLGAAMCLLMLPPLVFQVRPALDAAFTYRLPTSMRLQDKPWQTPVGTVWVDDQTRQALSNLRGAAQHSGLGAGAPMLDFTGDGPGLVVALAGRPVGVPWLVGGYPNSATWAQRLLSGLARGKLSEAWLLSSPDNPRAIPGWPALLAERIGPQTHVLASSFIVRAPSAWGEAPVPDATVCLWRPVSAAGLAAQAVPDTPASCVSLLARPRPQP